MKTSKDIGCGSATKPNIGSGSASHGIKVHQQLDHGQISIVCIGDLSTSVFSPDIVGEKVAEKFTVDAVVRGRDVNHDERLEKEDELEKLNSVEFCRQQDPIALGRADYKHRLGALWTTL
ncbi:hypothetical protein NC653_000945 [Populus alba x Populus x berolinensis]|uniref:Uncharacterized protein n=1 Tax=Populus alba x Populus x berolinensis TaxID=444605 RepID=A0AAD6WF10_9ROSI|nr:hypothetical protein NC653_000940 [Populus alba x Populus x berolinensis]KAJ7010355.1 hypothetical protein NC653_000945 [Populus alba x Populus x berolinensis]